MSKMISVASGFQYSVNIGYDLNNDDKLKNFIPTKSALLLLEDILLSTNPTSTDRARVLVGAYTIILQKGNHRSRHLSAICFPEATTSQRMARSITR